MRGLHCHGAVVLALVATFALGLLFPAAALAHAVFVSSTPSPGARLVQPPASVRILFSEPLNGGLSGIDVYDSSAKEIIPSGAHVDPADGRAYVLSLPLLSADEYTVLWHTVSLVDGHAYQGSFTFTVLRPDGSAPAVHAATPTAISRLQTPAAVDAIAKWLALLGLFLLTGATFAGYQLSAISHQPSIRGDATFARVRAALSRVTAAGVVALLLGSFEQLLAVALPASGALDSALLSRFGAWWLIRIGAVSALAVIARRYLTPAPSLERKGIGGGNSDEGARMPGQRRAATIGAGLLVLLLALTFSTTSHGAASARPGWGTVFDFVHLLSASIWVGGLAVLAILFLLPSPGEDERRCRRLLHRFSLAAGMAVPAVLISGIGSGLIEVGSPRDLISSLYGATLLAKLALVIPLLAIAGLDAFRLRPAFEAGEAVGRRLHWSVLAEAILALAVLVPAAAMTVQVPARTRDEVASAARQIAANSDPSSQFSGNAQVSGQAVTVTITPDAVGINQARVELRGTAAIATVRLKLIGPDGSATSASLARTSVETANPSDVRTLYDGTLRLDGAQGLWQATVELPGGSGPNPPLLVPVSPANAESNTRASAPPVAWLAVALLALLSAVAAASSRVSYSRLARGLSFSFTGAGVAAAVIVGVLAASGGATQPHPASWGQSAAVTPQTAGQFQTWTIPTPNGGLMIPAVGPDGSVWVGEMDGNKLARLLPDRKTIQELSFGGAIKSIMAVAVDSHGVVWIAQESAGAIGRFDPVTGKYEEFATPTANSAPTGMAIDGAGNVWFTELATGKIGRYEPISNRFTEYALSTVNSAPYWLTVGAHGRIWFTELSGEQIGVLDPATGQVHEFPTPGGERPTGIALDGTGNVLAGTVNGSLLRLDASAPDRPMARFKAPSGSIYGVVAGRNGRVWLGTTGNTLYAYDMRAGALQAFTLPNGSGPWWPATGADGSVWVVLGSHAGNALARLMSAGGN